MSAYILGLDISTTCVGWALLSVDYSPKNHDLRFGKIIPPTSTKKNPVGWFERAAFVFNGIDQLIAGAQNPDFTPEPIVAVAVEQLNCFRGGDTTRQLAGMGMGVQYRLYDRFKLEPIEMYTSTMKKAFTGRGDAKKWDMIAQANRLYDLHLIWPQTPKLQKDKTINDEDVADAIAAAHTLLVEVGPELRASLRRAI